MLLAGLAAGAALSAGAWEVVSVLRSGLHTMESWFTVMDRSGMICPQVRHGVPGSMVHLRQAAYYQCLPCLVTSF